MPLTRKQAWRRVRVCCHKKKPTEAKVDTSAPCKNKLSGRDMKQQQQQQQQQQQPQQQQQQQQQPQQQPQPQPQQQQQRRRQQRSLERAPSSGKQGVRKGGGGGGGIGSPEKRVLDKWRLPKEGREPSARPGVSAAKRQAAAACVRVGSRVSFNTVVAAILIPSAKDLHAAARNELWWQETDYRDFRMNFIQFMRTSPSIAVAEDGPEMVPVDIVAEAQPPSASSSPEVEQGDTAAHAAVVKIDVQPIIVGAVVYDNPVCCDSVTASEEKEPCVPQAWAVEPEQEANVAAGNGASREAVAAASAPAIMSGEEKTANDPAEENASSARLPTTTPPANVFAPVGAYAPPGAPLPRITRDFTVGDEKDSGAAAKGGAKGGGSWDEQERTQRVAPSLGGLSGDSASASSAADAAAAEEGEEEDGEGNTIRVRRAFSNLETARRRGAGLDSEITSEGASDSDEDRGRRERSEGSHGRRPRALSLDGWFTCGLENGAVGKSYETHDHAGRLRDLVKLPPFPAVCATPPRASKPTVEADLTEVLRRLRVAFNVSVENHENANGASARIVRDGVAPHGESKCRGEGDSAVVEFAPATHAAAAAAMKVSKLVGVGSRGLSGRLVGSSTMASHIDVCVS